MTTKEMLALLALAGVIVASGCEGDDGNGGSSDGGKPVEGGEIVVGSARAHNSWNGAEADDVDDAKIQSLVLEPLIRQGMGRSGEPEPGIAQSWELSPDGKELTVELREGVKFSDGSPLTADDVVFSFDQWKDPAHINGYLIRFVESAKASPDGRSVTFTSSQPNGFLPYALSYGAFGVVPKDFGGRSKKAFYKDPTGAGPFTVASQKVGAAGIEEAVLRKNKRYYGDKAHLDQITLRTIPDGNQLALQFESGQLDMVDDVAPNLADRYDADAVQYLPYGATKAAFASWKSQPYLSDARMRRALSLAIDREKLIDGYWNGHAKSVNRFSAETLPDMPGPAHGDWRTYDPEEAKRLVEEVGYDGRTLLMDINAEGQGHQVLSQALVQMFDAIGVKAKIRSNPDSTSYFMRLAGADYKGGDFDLAIGGTEGGVNSPADLISAYDEFAWFGVGAPPEVAKDFRARAVAAKDPAELREVMADVEQWAYDNTVMLPIAQADIVVAVDPELKGVKQNLVGVWRPTDWYVSR